MMTKHLYCSFATSAASAPAALAAMAATVLLAGLAGGSAAADEFILKDGKWAAAPKPAKGTVEGELALIRQQIEDKNFKAARAAADQFLKDHPDSPSCEEAMLLGAQAELDNGMYYQAFERLEAMLAKYPNGLFLERALTREMEVANAFLAGKKRIVGGVLRLPAADEGLTILRKISEHAPGTDIGERALLRIGEYRFQQKQYRDSADAYDEFLTLNPKSARVPHTMALAAESMYESFKGVAYDETPLVEAEARYKALLAQYPDEARKCRAADMVREITAIRGERAYETAKFYERTGKPQSAVFYYRQVVEEFPSTVWASEARTKVGVAPRQPSTKPAGEEPKPAAIEAKHGKEGWSMGPEAASVTVTESGFGKAVIGEKLAATTKPAATETPAAKKPKKKKPAPAEPPPPGMTEVKFDFAKTAAGPATQPATQPAIEAPSGAPEPAAQDKPAATAPQQGPQGPATPVDLEKLGNPSDNPSSKGQSK
jgi:outer membrane assembly lipoprotein YfiO